jgi:aminoglycoside phosphotransferase (APT) family kinase protein
MPGTPRARATRALEANAPELRDVEIVELGHGLDNTAFAVGDLALRVGDGPGAGREARLLEIVAAQVSIPVPLPRFADEDAGVLAYERIPGRPLLGRDPPPGAAAELGRFLRGLHDIDATAVTDLIPIEDANPAEWLDGLEGPRDLLHELHESAPARSPERVVAHADLGAEHVLELDGALTGIIDWSDAAVTDPAVDFARLYRDFGPASLDELLQAYGPLPDAMPRIEFFARCAALEDLAYGRATGRREYAENAERSFEWLFAA